MTAAAGAAAPANRLSREKSPYLLQHAQDPVGWYPWGPEAFTKARRENKPVFLSIGFSTCHWCHVMQRESFENPAVAILLNERFVPVLVDREERPDIDRLYLSAAEAAGWSSGWPLNLWLTPELKPFFGGSYFPPEPRGAQTGFKELLVRIEELWRTRHDDALRDAEDVGRALKDYTRVDVGAGTLDAAALEAGFRAYRLAFDAKHGGFGSAPKFPRTSDLFFLLRHHARTGDKEALEMTTRTLRGMAQGAIYDRIGGGFHRYTTDMAWKHPHFEKMLYDNAQLATVYLEAYQVTGSSEFAHTARQTLDYLLRDLALPEGGFATAEDADADYYSLPSAEARAGRTRPFRDDKVLSGYNGLAISALAKGARILTEPRYLLAAENTARYLHANLYDAKSNRLYRRWRDGQRGAPGFAEDYAFTTAGLLDLYETSFEPKWLAWATRLAQAQLELFYDAEAGGFYSSAKTDEENLLPRLLEDADGSVPSPGAAATLNALRLHALSERKDFLRAAEKTLRRFRARMESSPLSLPALLCALDFRLSKTKLITISGVPEKADTRALLREAHRRYLPNAVLEFVFKRGPAKASVCTDNICSLPTGDAAALGKILDDKNMEIK